MARRSRTAEPTAITTKVTARPSGVRFDFSNRGAIHYGAGRRHEVGAILDELGSRRALLICGRHFADGDQFSAMKRAIGSRIAGVFADVAPHSSTVELERSTELARDVGADAIVAIGGGSVLGLAKCAVVWLAEGGDIQKLAWNYTPAGPGDGLHIPTLHKEKIPIIALPTTAGSASETNQYGSVRDPTTREKVRIRDPKATPRHVILDPELTVTMGPAMTAETGVNALAHCIETVYSRDAQPFSTALALEAARLMAENLPKCVADPTNLKGRGMQQIATSMSGIALANAMVGLHHALCHPLGQICDVSHGAANYVMLPHALQYNLPSVRNELCLVVTTMGLGDFRNPSDAEEALLSLTEWLRDLGAPSRLRDVGGVTEEVLPALANSAFEDTCIPYNPVRVENAEALVEIYKRAW